MSNLKSPERKAIRFSLQILLIVLIIAAAVMARSGSIPLASKSKTSIINLTKP